MNEADHKCSPGDIIWGSIIDWDDEFENGEVQGYCYQCRKKFVEVFVPKEIKDDEGNVLL